MKHLTYIFAVAMLFSACSTTKYNAAQPDRVGKGIYKCPRSGCPVPAVTDRGKDVIPCPVQEAMPQVTYVFRCPKEPGLILFAFDSSVLRPAAIATVNSYIDWMKENPTAKVVIEGHADERGTNAYNMSLGQRRADSVKAHLVANGISPERVGTVSYGEERPAIARSDTYSWAQNRRAVIVVQPQ